MTAFLLLTLPCIFRQSYTSPIFIPGDLVQIVNLKPQKNASANVRDLMQLFDYSFGFVIERTFNKTMKRFECTVEHFEDRSKKLKIKEKYLRLLPIIRLHAGDAVSHDFDTFVHYWRYISKGGDQCTFNVAQLGPKLWMQTQDERIKKNMIRSVITQTYTLYALIYRFIRDKASIDNFIRIMESMPTVMRKRFINSIKQRLKGDYANVVRQIVGILNKQYPKYSAEMGAVLNSLDHKSIGVLLDGVCKEFQSIREVWSGIMKAKHGTDNLSKLFCLDIVRNYQENELVAVRGTFNVILWDNMDPNLLKKRIIKRLLQYPEYYGSAALMEHIVQIADGKLNTAQKVVHSKRTGFQTTIKIILWLALCYATKMMFQKEDLLSVLYFWVICAIWVIHTLYVEYQDDPLVDMICFLYIFGAHLLRLIVCFNRRFVRIRFI